MKYHPARERIYLSVLFLAKGKRGIRDRLVDVYQNHLLPLQDRDFITDKQKEDFAEIVSSLERLNGFSDDECSYLAEKIVSLYNDCVESKYED